MKTMDIILVIVGAALLTFTVTMLVTFYLCGSIPDTLCTCVFAALGGECGAMAWIKTEKEKQAEKQEEKERENNADE